MRPDRLSAHGRDILKRLEGFSETAYIPVPGDVPTIGYGFTDGVEMGDTMTREEADNVLSKVLAPYENAVYLSCTVKPNQNEFDAMVLLCFNIGIAGFRKSTVLKAHNANDKQAAARAFGLWAKAGGKTYTGLVRRRASEAALYLEPVEREEIQKPEMPQTIEHERPMANSEINRASVVAGGTATAAAVTEALDAVNSVKYGVQSLGDWLVPVLLISVAVLCGYIIWQRYRQRSGGWA